MAETRAHAESNYMAIFWWLAILTVVEIGVIFIALPLVVRVVALVALALAKAALVAMYFMHLRFETRTLAYVAVIPLLLGGLLIFLLLPDHRGTEHRTVESKLSAPEH